MSAGDGVAWAQKADKAAADALFSEGKKLITAGDVEAACAKFEASLARVAQLGTQLALASCYEKLGRTASAWAEFRAAAGAARKARDAQRQRYAEDHATALEAKLSKLVIKTEPGYRIDGLQVKRDGLDVAPAELGTPVPVDPGDHTVEANAPGWVAWSTKVTVDALPGVVEVIVPALGKAPIKVEPPAPEPVAPPQPVAAPVSGDPLRTRRHIAYGLGAGGLAVIATSLVLGAKASSRWGEAKDHCVGSLCDQTGVDLAASARSLGNLSTATFLIGTAALAGGVVLYVKTRSAGERPTASAALQVVPSVAPAQVGLTLMGGF